MCYEQIQEECQFEEDKIASLASSAERLKSYSILDRDDVLVNVIAFYL